MSKVVQVTFSEQEFNYLRKEADKKGITIPLLIKSKILPHSDFDKIFNQLKEKVANLDADTIFTVRDVFCGRWKEIQTGVRLSLGRTFYRHVTNGAIKGIEPLPYKDSSNTQLYKKL